MIGTALYHEAFLHHLPAQLADYGQRLMRAAAAHANAHDVEDALHVRLIANEPRSPSPHEMARMQVHVAASAARWALWWSSRGHGLDANW